jgi:ribosome assembly protein YihI (activator of Der GTPase)
MSQAIHLDLELPGDLARFKLPAGVNERLSALLDKQDAGEELTAQERREAEGLVDLADTLSYLGLKAKAAA